MLYGGLHDLCYMRRKVVRLLSGLWAGKNIHLRYTHQHQHHRQRCGGRSLLGYLRISASGVLGVFSAICARTGRKIAVDVPEFHMLNIRACDFIFDLVYFLRMRIPRLLPKARDITGEWRIGYHHLLDTPSGGEGGIRTLGWFYPSHDFQSCALDQARRLLQILLATFHIIIISGGAVKNFPQVKKESPSRRQRCEDFSL